MIKLFISDIEELLEKRHFSDNIKKVLEILLLAVNDWSNAVDSFNDYELEVQNFIKDTTTKNHIEKVLCDIDFSKYAWQAESLSELLEVYDYFENGISLKEIINQTHRLAQV